MPSGDVSFQDLLSIGAISGVVSAIGTKLLDIVAEEIKLRRSLKSDLKKKWLEKRDEKRLSLYEQLYSHLDGLTDLGIGATEEDTETKIEVTELFLRVNNLYVDQDIILLSYACCDYFKQVVRGQTPRSPTNEKIYLDKFKAFFNNE